ERVAGGGTAGESKASVRGTPSQSPVLLARRPPRRPPPKAAKAEATATEVHRDDKALVLTRSHRALCGSRRVREPLEPCQRIIPRAGGAAGVRGTGGARPACCEPAGRRRRPHPRGISRRPHAGRDCVRAHGGA